MTHDWRHSPPTRSECRCIYPTIKIRGGPRAYSHSKKREQHPSLELNFIPTSSRAKANKQTTVIRKGLIRVGAGNVELTTRGRTRTLFIWSCWKATSRLDSNLGSSSSFLVVPMANTLQESDNEMWDGSGSGNSAPNSNERPPSRPKPTHKQQFGISFVFLPCHQIQQICSAWNQSTPWMFVYVPHHQGARGGGRKGWRAIWRTSGPISSSQLTRHYLSSSITYSSNVPENNWICNSCLQHNNRKRQGAVMSLIRVSIEALFPPLPVFPTSSFGSPTAPAPPSPSARTKLMFGLRNL